MFDMFPVRISQCGTFWALRSQTARKRQEDANVIWDIEVWSFP